MTLAFAFNDITVVYRPQTQRLAFRSQRDSQLSGQIDIETLPGNGTPWDIAVWLVLQIDAGAYESLSSPYPEMGWCLPQHRFAGV